MHHFFEAITNTAGDSLIGYFARVIDRTTQNTVTLSSDDNGTPIVTVSGVENMAKSDAYGNLSLYVVPGTYHLDIYAPNTTSFLYRVSDVAMNSTKGDPGPQGEQGPDGEGLADVMAPGGAALVNYDGRSAADKFGEVRSLKDTAFAGGAIGDNSTNNAAALIAALAPAAGGYKNAPIGVYRTSQITQTLQPGQPHIIDGEGIGVTVFRKAAANSDAVFSLTGAVGNLDNYTVFRGFTADNALRATKDGKGIALSGTARSVHKDLYLNGFATGYLLQSTLVVSHYSCNYVTNDVGVRTERNSGGVYCNALKWIGGNVTQNRLGMDFGQGAGISLIGVNVESNGVLGDATSGGIRLRSNLSEETGYATFNIIDCHLEGNAGSGSLFGSGLTGVHANLAFNEFVGAPGRPDINLQGTRTVTLLGNNAPTGDTLIQASGVSTVMGGIHFNLNDTSTNYFHNTDTAAGPRINWMSQFRLNHSQTAPTANDLLIGTAPAITGGNANDSYIYKYGSGTVTFGGPTGDKITFSTGGIGFFGATPQPRGAAIANPTDAATTQSALIALLTYLRARGDIAP